MSCFDHNKYVSVTLEFRCNLGCVHCMIEDSMGWLTPQTVETFESILETNKRERNWSGIILTGAEITLRHDLPDLVRLARESAFENVRIQTHGMRLADPDYCALLIDAGVDEFFVSAPGADAVTHDGITQVVGSFGKLMRGLENLDKYSHVSVITNTVVTEKSYALLPDIVRQFQRFKNLVQMEYWVYFPMQETDKKNLIARHTKILPYLKEAIALNRTAGVGVEVKNFPECLLAEDADVLLNDQPLLFIDERFWAEFTRNGFEQCFYREQCQSNQCLGLNTGYIDKFGWEKDVLSPIKG